MKRMRASTMAFCGGLSLFGGVTMAVQDSMGLEAYIEHLRASWVILSPWWGVGCAVAGCVFLWMARTDEDIIVDVGRKLYAAGKWKKFEGHE